MNRNKKIVLWAGISIICIVVLWQFLAIRAELKTIERKVHSLEMTVVGKERHRSPTVRYRPTRGLESRVDDLESKIDELESKVNGLE